MTFVTIAIYAAAVSLCVAIAAGILRFWLRHLPYSPTDAQYLIVAVTLVLSAGFGALLGSNIVIAFGLGG
jgi:hypothetical protein